jgi:hypothetical protein
MFCHNGNGILFKIKGKNMHPGELNSGPLRSWALNLSARLHLSIDDISTNIIYIIYIFNFIKIRRVY